MAFAQEIFNGAKVFLVHREMLLELCPVDDPSQPDCTDI
jgi:hypothetical protein